MKYKTYILQSEQDSSFYIGYTEDLEKRLLFHNQGLSKYTSKKIPWKVAYFEEFETRSEAQKRELFLKKQTKKSFFL
ncbi:GIY-YIG nuclease family protein (plasmid) [Pedobacter sp. BS3]|uniref:GIY-YIG nuclease family protein n=1 Tax=Pedobacter sp. BS3 TaxID=2567937 RepID=UPI0011EF6191|nr:GIY-YIG nuclease family protein [Pedobacter sp. BS3]TZF85999.1 GIY-YIG nuclease family protein [Pedobacter sp. BS3]